MTSVEASQLPLIFVMVKSKYLILPLQLWVSIFIGVLSVEIKKSVVFDKFTSSILTLSQSVLMFVILNEIVLPAEIATGVPSKTVDPPKISTWMSCALPIKLSSKKNMTILKINNPLRDLIFM